MATPTQLSRGGQISGNVLFYTKPEPLSPELHKGLGVKRLDGPFGFARPGHAVPLTVTEFSIASLTFPIIFVGDDKTPLAVLGLNADQNMFLRIDRAAEFIVEGGDLPFFNPDGSASEYTQNCIEFCNNYEIERQKTISFVQLLKDLDLFEVKTATHTPINPDGTAGEPQQIAEYFGISEEKLNALPHDKLAELRDNGALQQIYAHLISLFGWDRLVALQIYKMSEAAAQAG